MRRISSCALVALLFASAAIAGPGGDKHKVKPPAACEATVPHLAEHTAAADAFTKKQFEDALAKANLRLTALTVKRMSPDSPALKGLRPGATFKLGGDDALFYTTQQGYGPSPFEFVTDDHDAIHRVVRNENVIGREAHLMCGCGPMGGGAVPPTFAIVYILPPGTHYDAAAITVHYDAKHVDLSYDWMVGGQRCQPPP